MTPGLRIDDHQLFGTETTYKVSSAYHILKTKTSLKANWGTGFKAPSLYQLYHPTYGSAVLQPDEGKSYDLGFEQNLFNDKITLGLIYFRNDFENMVDYDSNTSKYKNIDNIETKGVELEFSFQPLEALTIGTNYTYTKTEDEDTGKALTKRPKNQTGFNINWVFREKGNLNLTASRIGHRWNNSANTLKTKPYTKVDLAAYYDLTETFHVFGSIENLFDEKFQQVYGYAAPGISFYAGFKATF